MKKKTAKIDLSHFKELTENEYNLLGGYASGVTYAILGNCQIGYYKDRLIVCCGNDGHYTYLKIER